MIEFVLMYFFACWLIMSSGTREKLASLLFEDHEREAAEATRTSIVQPAPRSEAARAKDKTKQTADELPVHSFRTLLADLGTLVKSRVRLQGETGSEFYELTQTTPLQQQAPWNCSA